MAPLWLAFRSSFRTNKRSWVALALLIGLAGGVVLGAAAGARRTDSSYTRFLAVSNPREVLGLLAEEVGVDLAAPPKRVADFGPVDNMPVVLAGLLGLIATATLIHTLVSAVRRRRPDLAILKTVGFVEAQVLTLFALLVGIPLGVAAGRRSWSAFADDLGTVPEPVVPLLVSLTVPLAVLVANAVAALPARAAARTRPAMILRSE